MGTDLVSHINKITFTFSIQIESLAHKHKHIESLSHKQIKLIFRIC